MERFFQLKEHGTKPSTEVIAGMTTFFAMAYILFVNPAMLSQTGMPYGAVFLATIFASVAGTLVMGLFANVPYAQAPGMGLNAFFTYTVVFALGFSWQQALAMVFLCGIINILITVTRVRKLLIQAIPQSLQHAIGGGIGIFIAYIGIKNAGLLNFTADPGSYIQLDSGTVITNSGVVPALVHFNSPTVIFALLSLFLMAILVVKKVPGAVFLSILLATVAGIFGTLFLGLPLVSLPEGGFSFGAQLSQSFRELGTTFGVAFGSEGMLSLFSDASRIPLVLMSIFAFSLTDTFDTIGTFIGTGRRSGIFDEQDQKALAESSGFHSKMDKALFSDAVATSVGAVFGSSNVTTYVESAAGIAAGGRTGLTAVVTAGLFLVSILLAPLVGVVPAQATAPALILVGIMMMGSFKELHWSELEEAIPAFFASIFMALIYSISYGIAAGFIFYCLVKCLLGKRNEIHPILWISTGLFVLNFIVLACIK